MEDFVYNAMINFQFFCNNAFKQKDIDKLVPYKMTYSEWNAQKAGIIKDEIESMSRYLEQQASVRLQALPLSSKEDLENKFQVIIQRAISDYKEKLYDYYH